MQQLAKAFRGKVIYTKGSFRLYGGIGTLRKEGERRKATQFLSIDQVRGHLTPNLLGHTQRQLSKREKGVAYRSDQRSFNSRSSLATPREKTEIDLTKKHPSSKSLSSYISQ